MDGCWVQACVESGGNWNKRKKEWRIGEEVFIFFRAFLPFPLPGLFAPALQAIEFAQYSFTVHNKVVVTENLGSVLQFHLKHVGETADVYSWQRCINNNSRRIQRKIRNWSKSPPRLARFVGLPLQKSKNLIELTLFHTRTRLKSVPNICQRSKVPHPFSNIP